MLIFGKVMWDLESLLCSDCGCGGIGRHVRLRGVWRKPCEFDSRHPHCPESKVTLGFC